MKTRKQILKEFLDAKAKSAVTAIATQEDKSVEAKKAERELNQKFYKALAERDTATLKELQAEIAKQYSEKALADGQNITNNGDGGYLVPVTLANAIREQLAYVSPIRQIATVIANMPAKLDLPFENAIPTTYWVSEGVAATQSKSTVTKSQLVSYKMAGFGKFSHESLVDTAVNPELQNFVAQRFALSLSQLENSAFVGGDGSGKPLGFRSGTFTTATGAIAGTALAYADLVKAFYGVHVASRGNGVWVMSTKAISLVVGLTDDNGRPIYVPAMSATAPATVLGRPVYEVTEIPSNLGTGTDETEIWYGDFKNYIIGDREGLRINFGTTGTDLESDMISLVIFKRVAGIPTYGTAFYKLTGVK